MRGGGGDFNRVIADNDSTPEAVDGTRFGAVDPAAGALVMPFRVRKGGDRALNISDRSVTGTHAADFCILNLSNTVAADGGFSDFANEFNPSAAGSPQRGDHPALQRYHYGSLHLCVRGTGQNPSAKPGIGLKREFASRILTGKSTPQHKPRHQRS